MIEAKQSRNPGRAFDLYSDLKRPVSTRLSWKESGILLWKADLAEPAPHFCALRPRGIQKMLPQEACCGTSATALAACLHLANTADFDAKRCQKMKIPRWSALLALALSACASSPADLQAAQMHQEQIATGFELTADGWQRLGVNEEQQAHYRKLAAEARKPGAANEVRTNSLLNRLLKALLGESPGPALD